MRRLYLFAAILIFVLAACRNNIAPEELAASAAKVYYEALVKGDYAQFVNGSIGNDSIPEDYRAAQIAGIHRYAEQINKAYGGLKAVEVLESTIGETPQEATVILNLQYADSTQKRIAVPMVERNGLWFLK